jgi:hypothetical protein
MTVSVKVPDRLTSMGHPAYRQPRGISCKVKLFSNFANIFETSSIRQYLSFSVLLRGLKRSKDVCAMVGFELASSQPLLIWQSTTVPTALSELSR